jgi:nitrate/TMAO reductase-like tetraheme cytochrome c subunit
MLKDDLDEGVGDNGPQEDEREQQRRETRASFLPEEEEKHQFQEPEVGDDDDLPYQPLVLLAEELAEAQARKNTDCIDCHYFRAIIETRKRSLLQK